MTTLPTHTEHWPLEKLVPYARNARTHTDAQVAQIAASIREFGFTNPIVVDSNAGIIAGHGRLLAARQLKLPEVPVIVLDHLSETQKHAYILVDNKLTENAGWDEDLLRLELAALQEEDYDLDLIGFEADEVAELMAGQNVGDGLTEEDSVPDLGETSISVTGDLWLLGDHRLLCGDPTLRADVRDPLIEFHREGAANRTAWAMNRTSRNFGASDTSSARTSSCCSVRSRFLVIACCYPHFDVFDLHRFRVPAETRAGCIAAK